MRLRLLIVALALTAIPFAVSTPVLGPRLAVAAQDGGLMSILVMGDSYSAGNGAGAYFGEDSCYRSANNYGRQYARLLEQAPYRQRTFVEVAACSGDTTKEFFRSKKKRRPQISAVTRGYDLILLTIGGNDLEFASIVTQCLVQATDNGKECDKLLSDAERALKNGSLRNRVDEVLRSVRSNADPRAQIVLVGYPYLEGDRDYTIPLGRSGQRVKVGKRLKGIADAGDRLQRNLVDDLNRTARGRASAFHLSTKALFRGHELKAGSWNASRWFVQPLTDSKTKPLFYHPNLRGWTETAKLLLRHASVAKRDRNSDPAPSPAPAPAPPAIEPPPQPLGVHPGGPLTGPVGYGPAFYGPVCPAPLGADPQITITVDGQPWRTLIGDYLRAPWGVSLGTHDLPAGSHTLTFACAARQGTSTGPTIWNDPGFALQLSGVARPVQLTPTTAAPTSDVDLFSGATDGPDPCPALGGALQGFEAGLYDDRGALAAGASVPWPSNSDRTSLGIPFDAEPGTTLTARVSCRIEFPAGGGGSFEFAPTFVAVT